MADEIGGVQGPNCRGRRFSSAVPCMLLVAIAIVSLGYAIFTKGEADKLRTQISEQNKSAGSIKTAPVAPENQDVYLREGDVKILANKANNVFEVWNADVKVGDIKESNDSQVYIWKEAEGNFYLGVDPLGLGGNILFSGPHEVYQLDPIENKLSKVYGDIKNIGFASDLSVNGERLVAVEYPGMGGEMAISVYDIASQNVKSYPVSAGYDQAGAKFSQAGGKIIYEAVISESSSGEEGFVPQYAMYMIDLATGKQQQIGGIEKMK